jgi:signal transduction histidine kinase/CheY-like chemotaxis protein
MNPALETAANHFATHKNALLERWRTLVRSDSTLPKQRLTFSDAELEDHLPALLDSIIEGLQGRQAGEGTIRGRGAEHGYSRRLSGYTIERVTWEFAIFRKLLRETLEEIAPSVTTQDLFAARELILEVTDRSEVGSIHQWVEETSRERDAARDALKEANEQKDRFLAVLSHELRNPLASITTAIHVVRAPGSAESQRQRALEIVERQADYQRRLVDDLLDVNRISQSKIQLKKECIDLRKTIEEAINSYLPAIEAKAINFRFARPDQQIMLVADAVRIEQIVSNLLANALKFTRSGGSIEILLSLEEGFAVIRVRDTGSGIEPEALKRIFDLFAQIQHPTNVGLGVGLWLAKTLVEMHEGTIEAASEGLDKGTAVTVRLPLAEDAPKTRTVAMKRVLLVEDDPEQRELMVMALSEGDAEVLGAMDGAEAIKLASENRFAVCILDLSLPDTTGYELVGRLLEIHDNNRPVTIALTGFGRPEDTDRVKRAGFDYHIVKPADISRLQRIISGQEG